MAKDFEKDLADLIKSHQDNEEPGARANLVSQLRTAAELAAKSDPWPGEIKASEKAQKAAQAPGAVPVAEPDETEDNRNKGRSTR